jgi:hypothetical protein
MWEWCHFLLLKVLRTFMQVGQSRPAVLFVCLLGRMTATVDVVFLARLKMRPLQFYVKRRWKHTQGLNYPIMLTSELQGILSWWLTPANIQRGWPLKAPSPEWILTTDASLGGWGEHVRPVDGSSRQILTQGLWSMQDAALHINILELRAVRLTIDRFKNLLRGKSVLIETDNSSVVSRINKF